MKKLKSLSEQCWGTTQQHQLPNTLLLHFFGVEGMEGDMNISSESPWDWRQASSGLGTELSTDPPNTVTFSDVLSNGGPARLQLKFWMTQQHTFCAKTRSTLLCHLRCSADWKLLLLKEKTYTFPLHHHSKTRGRCVYWGYLGCTTMRLTSPFLGEVTFFNCSLVKHMPQRSHLPSSFTLFKITYTTFIIRSKLRKKLCLRCQSLQWSLINHRMILLSLDQHPVYLKHKY